MKKSMKKLVLTKETVRRLAGAELNGVAGGYWTYACPSNTCPSDPTLRCESFEVACIEDTSKCPPTYGCSVDVC